jgi:hypothetical protein
MHLEFARSAGRHGIADERARHVITDCQWPIYAHDDLEDAVLFLGTDQFGVELEVVGVELADGSLRVIHAMRMRRKYRARYEELVRWYER